MAQKYCKAEEIYTKTGKTVLYIEGGKRERETHITQDMCQEEGEGGG